MIYTVKSKSELKDLIDILQEEGIPVSYDVLNVFEADIKNEKDLDIFTNILSFFISFKALDIQLQTNFDKKNIPLKKAMLLKDDLLYDVNTSHYLYTFTRILLKEYFKKMQTVNVDSFILFNMKGFKEEIKSFADSLITAQDEAEQEHEGNALELDSTEYGMDDLFSVLRERAIALGLNMKEYKELHVYQIGDFFHFENSKAIVLDQEFFLEHLGSSLEFQVGELVENEELLEGLMISSVLIQIFGINKIVVHNDVSEQAKNALIYNINALKKETNKRIKVVNCNGCKFCK